MVREDNGNARGSTVAPGMEMGGKYSYTGTSPQEGSYSILVVTLLFSSQTKHCFISSRKSL